MSRNPEIEKEHLTNMLLLSVPSFIFLAFGGFANVNDESSVLVLGLFGATAIALIYMFTQFYFNPKLTNERARKISLTPFWLYAGLLVSGILFSIYDTIKEN